MNIDEITLGQAKELSSLFSKTESTPNTLKSMVGEWVIVRTYSAGVHFGKLKEKSGSEVILHQARRLYYWKTNGGISLSEVSLTGLHDDSKVCGTVEQIWMDAIEIIPCTDEARASIQAKADYAA